MKPRQETDWVDEFVGALAGMLTAGVATDPMARLSAKARAELARTRSIALRAAEDLAGMTREDLGERIAANPKLVPIAARVLWQAGMTGQDEVLEALGAVLGNAAAHPDRADEAEVLLLGIEALRRQHIALLRVMAGPPQWKSNEPEPYQDLQPVQVTALGEAERWNVEALAEASGMTDDQAALAATGLSNAGFARALSVLGGTGFQVTEMGQVLLEVLDVYETRRA
ncbi:hypothetical protein [Nocardioides pocheonensis]|uniref:Uncharacterized protein n=1 Tax=Nocardioides pocheonensis TaxID=661485 RepID=A0A3N0GJ37_9ACTN|nr:hypothetical protein [Nocardioides pocheonensis]RNM12226.1 hypothetical protein EFL26_20730 [Nocardioides pocheonensis]